jgi:hypothetical protein
MVFSHPMLVFLIALVFFIVSVCLAVATNSVANPNIWALWSLCIFFIFGGIAGVAWK